MMPKKDPNELRSHLFGVKVNEETKLKINYLAGMCGEKAGTYIYKLLQDHIKVKEPWITKEIENLSEKEKALVLRGEFINGELC